MTQDNLIRLQCTECKNFNYQTHRNLRRQDSTKLELKKFCATCRQHQVHKEKGKK